MKLTDQQEEYFRAYDIRGVVGPGKINDELAMAIGKAVGSEIKKPLKKEVIVGRDGRISSPDLTKAVIEGLNLSGCDVIDIGMVPTPLVYYATHRLSAKSGIMVTASHNPKDQNGFKVIINQNTLTKDGINGIYQRIVKEQFEKGHGGIVKKDIIADYIDYITNHIHLARPLRVAMDFGNGIAGETAIKLFKALGCEVSALYSEVDGNFPHHHPDPANPQNLTDLMKEIKNFKADIGLAFDGDGDRLGVVTDQGKIIWPDRLMMLFAKDLLSRKPKASIIFDVKCSSLLPKVIKENGGNPIMYRTGHSFIKKKMHEINAPLAGEMSGHIYLTENWFGFDDGVYAAARLVEILSLEKKKVSEVFDAFPDSVNTPELKIPMADDKKASFMKKLISNAKFEDGHNITIDGLRVDFSYGGFGLVRPSNTTQNLVLRFEAKDEAGLKKIQNLFKERLLSIDPTLKMPF